MRGVGGGGRRRGGVVGVFSIVLLESARGVGVALRDATDGALRGATDGGTLFPPPKLFFSRNDSPPSSPASRFFRVFEYPIPRVPRLSCESTHTLTRPDVVRLICFLNASTLKNKSRHRLLPPKEHTRETFRRRRTVHADRRLFAGHRSAVPRRRRGDPFVLVI